MALYKSLKVHQRHFVGLHTINEEQKLKQSEICNGFWVYLGQPSNVETVNRASIPLSTLSKLKSLLIHSLLATTVSCSELSMCFRKDPLKACRVSGDSKIALQFWEMQSQRCEDCFALLAFLCSNFGRICAAVEFTLGGKGWLETNLIFKQPGFYFSDDQFKNMSFMVSY